MDVVLRGYLKYKAKGSWPKNWTKMWFILRNKSDGSKQLEYYENERKSTVTNAVPKGIIYLNNVMLVQRLPEPDKKTQFMMTFTGTVQYRHFDAPSEYNMEEWVTSLNSIIFSKIIGDVVFLVDMHKSDAVPFHGPCELKLEDETITVRNRVNKANPHQQQFQWGIAHVKKFWVKSDVHQLVILVGRQSSTGPGEFVFTTAQSMQIMHGITAMLNEAKRKLGLNMPLTAPASVVEAHTMDRPISTARSQSTKVQAASVTSEKQQRVLTLPVNHAYDKANFHFKTDTPSYNVLQHHANKEKKLSVVSQPYDVLDHSDSNRNSVASLHLSPHVSPRTSPRTSPSSSRKSSYASLQSSITEENEPSLDQTDSGDYGKLVHTNRSPQQPPKKISSEHGRLSQRMPYEPSTQESEYGKLDHTSHLPSLHPKRNTIQENEYGKLNHTTQPYERPQRSTTVQENQYGKLNYASNYPPEVPQKRATVQENEYGKLEHSMQHEAVLESQNVYSKLDHAGRPPELPPKRTTIQENMYGKLEHSNQYVSTPGPSADTPPDLPQRNVMQENEYGRLVHFSHRDAEVSGVMQQSEYGRLDHSEKHKQSSQQDASVIQQNKRKAFSTTQLDKPSHKPQVPQRKSHDHSSRFGKVEDEADLQTGGIPTGYSTFKREHGYSISSSVTSYDSDQDDKSANGSDKCFSVPGNNNDTEYSQLTHVTDDVNLSAKSIQAVKQTPNPLYMQSEKPKPKPRNV